MDKENQNMKILNFLKNGEELTVRQAVTDLNVMSVPRRIMELRNAGYPITTEWRVSENGARYGVYKLQEVNNG